ncbi:response regulator [Simiduia agarivorans]|uniref:histidine kinase n=1 Tax=Simiduia agarivorans (strain DSM 21679 / JCM 13881 / BCRC 17597 / SA1) TaxID=1117647 RepID=K4KI00_SIMAS|nr:response regulator [Simiduia agarivorans]AFU97820.1 response regulator receiver domain-containing protein [Simiduia agarivorans SA1 = DSM 21679]
MLQLFIPANKVQKDRKIMRETDARMAKYSRRGLILNLVAFGLCLALGDFYTEAPNFALTLAIGLLIITLWRGYFLFRFDSLYPRAPGRWRSHYFWASFVGAGWWSLIVASITYTIGMQNDTLLIWLYSVVFYSSVASVLSPYRKFLGMYLFIGQIPAGATAVMLGTWEGYIYGVMMLVFYLLLDHQGEVNSRIYWDRLEAQYNLDQHARNLEIEKRDTQAAAELKNTFLSRFGTEIRTSLNDILGSLSLLADSSLTAQQKEFIALAVKAGERQLNMVDAAIDFSKVTNQNLVLEKSIFNLWKLIEHVVEDVAHDAYQQDVELNHVLDSDTPIRVKGDNQRLEQVLINLLSHAIKHSAFGSILFKSEFVLKNDQQGELQITIIDEYQGATLPAQPNKKQENVKDADPEEPLGITLCKGIAEFMNGSLQVYEEPGKGVQYFFNVTLELTSKSPKALAVNPQLRNKKMLLVGIPPSIEESFHIEMEAWGMDIEMTQDPDQAIQLMEDAEKDEKPFDGLLIYTLVKSLDSLVLAEKLAQHQHFQATPFVIACTLAQRADERVDRIAAGQTVLLKPVLRKNLHQAVCQSLLKADEATLEKDKSGPQGNGRRVLLVDDHRVNQMVSKGMLGKLGYKVVIANNGREALAALEEQPFDLVLMDCQMPEMDGYEATQAIRRKEQAQGVSKPLPVVAMTAHAGESDQAKCYAAGMSDYLAKPVSFEKLEQNLRRWLGKNTDQD